MNFEITVIRKRQSVTQGTAAVCLNGKELISFGDTIEIIKDSLPSYGKLIGGYASVTPDADFVNGLLFHQHDDLYKYSDKLKKALIAFNPNRFEAVNGIIFTAEMTVDSKEYFNGYGVEFIEVFKDFYYTETIMTAAEFSQLNFVTKIKHLA